MGNNFRTEKLDLEMSNLLKFDIPRSSFLVQKLLIEQKL